MLILILFLLSKAKLYVFVVTLSAKDNLRKEFERLAYWNEYKWD